MLKVLDLFAGAGGFTLSGEMAGGFETVAFCEIDKQSQKVLRKNWPHVPLFEDVTKLKGADVGTVDVITGGFPCQDLSAAGKGEGIGEGTRSGLFREMLRLAQETGRPYIIFENVSRLLSGPAENPGEWFGEFLWSLAEIGYDAEWFCVTASGFGAPHERRRVCVVAYPDQDSWSPLRGECKNLKGEGSGRYVLGRGSDGMAEREESISGPREVRSVYERFSSRYAAGNFNNWNDWGGGESPICRVDDGIPKGSYRNRVGIMGNSIVPPLWSVVMESVREHIEARND